MPSLHVFQDTLGLFRLPSFPMLRPTLSNLNLDSCYFSSHLEGSRNIFQCSSIFARQIFKHNGSNDKTPNLDEEGKKIPL